MGPYNLSKTVLLSTICYSVTELQRLNIFQFSLKYPVSEIWKLNMICTVRALWISYLRGLTHLGPIIGGAQPMFQPPHSSKIPKYWWGSSPLSPPITPSLDMYIMEIWNCEISNFLRKWPKFFSIWTSKYWSLIFGNFWTTLRKSLWKLLKRSQRIGPLGPRTGTLPTPEGRAVAAKRPKRVVK